MQLPEADGGLAGLRQAAGPYEVHLPRRRYTCGPGRHERLRYWVHRRSWSCRPCTCRIPACTCR